MVIFHNRSSSTTGRGSLSNKIYVSRIEELNVNTPLRATLERGQNAFKKERRHEANRVRKKNPQDVIKQPDTTNQK